jgi:HK97 family phage major capsid protein
MSYLDKVVERRDAVKAEMDAVLEAVAEENRTDLTAEETEKVDALVEESRSLDTKIEKLKTQADADAKAAEVRSTVAPVATPAGGARVKTLHYVVMVHLVLLLHIVMEFSLHSLWVFV